MNIFDLFDATYIINLPYRTDRRKSCIKELAALGTAPGKSNIEFFDAIRPDSLDGFKTLGSRGSLLSHLKALQLARSRNAEKIFLIEDDVAFSPRMMEPAFLEKLKSKLDADWDIIYFGHDQTGGDEHGDIRIVQHETNLLQTHCMAFNGRITDSLIQYLQEVIQRPAGHPDGGKMGFDPSINMFRERTENLTFITTPCLAFQRPSRTDLGQHKWFDSIPIIKQSANSFREIYASWQRWKRFHTKS